MVVKEKIGTVVSDKMEKTVVVLVENLYSHPLYGKTLKTSKRFLAHDELNKCDLGDTVLISETRPLSRKKRWQIKKIFKKNIVTNI